MATIKRTGVVVFTDAGIDVWEEGIGEARRDGGMRGASAWEQQFKRDVFARIVRQLNRLEWHCEIQADLVKQYGMAFARNHRYCRKGDLQAELEVGGRHIKLAMWQSVNTPTRPDQDGKYEHNKEGIMPYPIRLEMERTRRRIRDYLCGVMEGYVFDPKKRSIYHPQLSQTAMERIEAAYAESWHFKGDWEAWLSRQTGFHAGYRTAADGQLLTHGQRVWFFDRKGRINTGTAIYNINNMWWVVTGKWDYTNVACHNLYSTLPENFRIKRNARLRRQRLEGEMNAAIKAMRFERAAQLRDLIFPPGEALFVVYHKGHGAYHRPGFRGYTTSITDAGKFTAAEVKGWNAGPNEVRELSSCNQ